MANNERLEALEKIKQALKAINVCFSSDIKEETTFNDLGMDSLDKLMFLLELEKLFNISIANESGSEWKTIGDAIDFVS